jgi:uncharacterized membrane protein
MQNAGIANIYVITSCLRHDDPRRKLALALKSKGLPCTVVRCHHGCGDQHMMHQGGGISLKAEHQLTENNFHKLKCGCRSCHVKVWRHAAKLGNIYHANQWIVIIDLAAITYQDTKTIIPWMFRVPKYKVNKECTLALFKRHVAAYMLNHRGISGILLKDKDRHPEEYMDLLKPCMITNNMTSIIGTILDALGFDHLTVILSQNILESVPKFPVISYYHILVICILLVNYRYWQNLPVSILCVLELLVLTILN